MRRDTEMTSWPGRGERCPSLCERTVLVVGLTPIWRLHAFRAVESRGFVLRPFALVSRSSGPKWVSWTPDWLPLWTDDGGSKRVIREGEAG